MPNLDTTLDGKVAVVTGASRGIGRGIASALAQFGAHVYLCARNEHALQDALRSIRAQGGSADAIKLDVTSEESWLTLLSQVRSTHGRVDILVNNAGVGAFGKPLHETPLEEFERMTATNLRGVYLGIKSVAPFMIASGGGDIVNISSIASKNPLKNGAAYAATKWAVNGLSVSAAEELRDHKIRVSVICPGSVDTELGPGMNRDTSKMLKPEDVAHAVITLVTQAPRSFISEVVIRPTLKP